MKCVLCLILILVITCASCSKSVGDDYNRKFENSSKSIRDQKKSKPIGADDLEWIEDVEATLAALSGAPARPIIASSQLRKNQYGQVLLVYWVELIDGDSEVAGVTLEDDTGGDRIVLRFGDLERSAIDESKDDFIVHFAIITVHNYAKTNLPQVEIPKNSSVRLLFHGDEVSEEVVPLRLFGDTQPVQ